MNLRRSDFKIIPETALLVHKSGLEIIPGTALLDKELKFTSQCSTTTAGREASPQLTL